MTEIPVSRHRQTASVSCPLGPVLPKDGPGGPSSGRLRLVECLGRGPVAERLPRTRNQATGNTRQRDTRSGCRYMPGDESTGLYGTGRARVY